MALITAGHTVTCADRKRVGGIKRIALANLEEVNSFTPASPGAEVTAITMASGKRFWEFQTPPESATFTETYEIGDETGSFVAIQALALNFGKLSQEAAVSIKALAGACDLVGVIELYNGEMFVLGRESGLNASEGSGTVEASKSGANTSVFTLQGRELDPADEYTGVFDNLLVAAL